MCIPTIWLQWSYKFIIFPTQIGQFSMIKEWTEIKRQGLKFDLTVTDLAFD